MREAIVAAKNVERTILCQPLQRFRYRTMGMLASIGHHTGVASFFGFKFSGFIARWMWRSVYIPKLPRLVKKLQVMIAWTLDLLFGRDIEQLITLHDVEELAESWTRIRGARVGSALANLSSPTPAWRRARRFPSRPRLQSSAGAAVPLPWRVCPPPMLRQET
jgi:hypothetical protein